MGMNLSTAAPVPDAISLESFAGSWRIKNKVLLDTLSYAAGTTDTTKTLDSGYDFYVLEGFLTHSAGANITLKVNAVASGYEETHIAATSVVRATSQTSFYLVNDDTSGAIVGAIIQATSKAAASSPVKIRNFSTGSTGDYLGIGGQVVIGNAVKVDTITIATASGTMTGTVKVYGANYGGLL